jgi:hypothetical protein
MTAVLAPTGSALGDYEQLMALDAERGAERTPLGLIMNPGLREAMNLFSVVASEPLAPLRCFVRTVDATSPDLFHDEEIVNRGTRVQVDLGLSEVGVFRFLSGSSQVPDLVIEPLDVQPVLGSADAVATVYEISRRLGLPVRDVLSAAGMRKSTFYTWTSPEAPKPRVASQAKLWQLAQFVEDIEALLGGSARRWLLGGVERLEMLGKGRFDDLLDELHKRAPNSDFPPTYAESYAVGGDHAVAEDSGETMTRRRIGRADVVASAGRNRRATR